MCAFHPCCRAIPVGVRDQVHDVRQGKKLKALEKDLPSQPNWLCDVRPDAGTARRKVLIGAHLNDGLDLRDVVLQHVLDAALERDGGGGAAAAGALHLDHHDARGLIKAPEQNVAPVFLDSRPDARFQQLLDHGHNLSSGAGPEKVSLS